MDHDVALAIARLRATWDAEVGPSLRRAIVAFLVALVFGVAHLARIGSPLSRGLAAAAIATTLVGLIAWIAVARRRRADLRRAVRLTVGKTDRELGEATVRAMGLLERASADDSAGSPELARLHLVRLLGRASTDRIGEGALAVARRLSTAGIVLGGAALVAVAIEPFRVVEGLDVLAATRGEAPILLDWIEEVELSSKPPDYLHGEDHPLAAFGAVQEPRGSILTVRGRPLRAGRNIVLTDGKTEVPFVDDGSGSLVARWTVTDSTEVSIAARFGAVLVRQPDVQPVTSIPDEPPKVAVEGAPRTVRLLDEPSIPIHYEATDDHGLREVHLVLRAGTREERRSLSRPQTDATVDRGGHELRASDAFFRRTYVPVEVRVEARDNDTVSGPKWGKSAPIIVVVPEVGEPEALRYEAMIAARDALTDLLANRMTDGAPKPGAAAGHLTAEAEAQARAVEAVQRALSGTYGGLKVRGVTAAVARGQLRRLEKGLKAERATPTGAAHGKLVDTTEEVLLAFDAATRALGSADTRKVAIRLADVADEAAAAANLAASPAEREAATMRLDAAVTVLAGGGRQMLRLGDLGLDLGEIVQNGLRRIARAREADSFFHAELAARDLAARLRVPEPSFSGGRGGVESGPPSSAPPDPNEASAADQEMAARQEELERLAREHAGEMEDVARALERAASPEDLEALREEAKRRADAIRQAVRDLPRPGAEPGTAESAAAAGREQAESMAGALERDNPADALDSGKSALRSLEDARKRGERAGGMFPEERAGREAGKAAETVRREVAWLEDAVRKLEERASERAKGDLEKSSGDEGKLADRTKQLGERGREGEGSLPDEVLDHLDEAEQAMRDATRSLQEGKGRQGHEQQQRAQRALEMAQNDRNEGEDGNRDQQNPSKQEGDEGAMSRQKTEIPGKDEHKGPEQFRRRVVEGLSTATDARLKKAVKRYAEGLLR